MYQRYIIKSTNRTEELEADINRAVKLGYKVCQIFTYGKEVHALMEVDAPTQKHSHVPNSITGG